MAEFTGERIIPGQVEPDLWNEHAARYWFASQYAASNRVLDAGCGAGYGARHLARSARTVAALDVAPEALAHARANYSLPNLAFVQGSCSAIPFASAGFELITSFEVIEHLADWRACLDEFRRVLAPDGVLLISTPNRTYYAESREQAGPNPFHVHEFDYEEFASALRALFPSVDLLAQNHTNGILLSPVGSPGGASAALETPLTDPEHANFFLAVCRLRPGTPPRPFVFVPTAANVLRERERHIAMLASDVAHLRSEKQNLVEMFRSQERQLLESNGWAAELDSTLTESRARVAGLQDELAAAQETAAAHIGRLETEKAEIAAGYAVKVRELEAELVQRTEWALSLQATAETLQTTLQALQNTVEAVKASRWVRLGTKFGVGPLPPEG